MDALLIALLGCLFGEIGDKGQLLVLALAHRYQRDGAIIAGVAVAAIVNAALSAAAGAWIGPMLGHDARLLFMALSLLFLGVGLLWPVKMPDTLDDWRIGPFLTTALGVFILGFGDGPQFLILGIATPHGRPGAGRDRRRDWRDRRQRAGDSDARPVPFRAAGARDSPGRRRHRHIGGCGHGDERDRPALIDSLHQPDR